MKILFILFLLLNMLFGASAKINDKENKKNNESLSLNKENFIQNENFIFLIKKRNELLMNFIKIKANL